MQVTVSRHINAPVHVTFAIFSDIRNLADHVDGITEVEILSDVSEGSGTRWRETRQVFGRTATEDMEIGAFTPNQAYTVVAASHGMAYNTVYLFTEKDGGTHVEMTFGGTPQTFLARLMTPLAFMTQGSVQQALEADMDNLKAVCEAKAAEV